MRLTITFVACALAGCGSGTHSNPGSAPDGGLPSGPGGGLPSGPGEPDGGGPPPPAVPLGMNDVSFFFPLPFSFPDFIPMTGVGQSGDLVPRELFHRIATAHQDIENFYEDFGVVTIRFDLCDRVALGPCPEDADGSLRLVFQATLPSRPDSFFDMGIHAFYSIPAAELASVIDQLRGIAQTRHQGNDAFTTFLETMPLSGGVFTEGLIGLVARYAKPDRLIRLALMGQDQRTTESRIVFRALELHDGQFQDVAISGAGATEQDLRVTDDGYTVSPAADQPAGFAIAQSAAAFAVASPADQQAALDALNTVENPLLTTQSTVQCVACHTSTSLGARGGHATGIDLKSLPSAFHSARDTGIQAGSSLTQASSVHAFSWHTADATSVTSPEIVQRVANETANVLDEIERRFPATSP